MFRVRINDTARLTGCPINGLEAVKFREEHGLPLSPSWSEMVEEVKPCAS